MSKTTTLVQSRIAEHKHWLYLAAAAVAIFVLFPQLIGFSSALRLLATASPLFLSLTLLAEALRYVISAMSTRVLARLFHRVVPLEPMVEAFFAGAAANRAFSTGGAPGMLVRLLFLKQEGVTTGAVAVIYLIEDIAGLVVGTGMFTIGVIALVNAHPSNQFILDTVVIMALAALMAGTAAVYVYRRRVWVEKIVHAIARGTSRVLAWFLGRPLYHPQHVQHSIDEFYGGMSIARRAPLYVVAAFGLNLARYIAGAAALYFAFQALGWSISPGILILLYTSSSVLSTISAVPGELALIGSSWALLTLSFGVPRDLAMMSLILYRTTAFWLPIPIGAAAFWNLRRRHLL